LKKQVEFRFQASYCVSHEPNFQEKEIWIVFHGYGQLAEFFIRKFRSFDSSDRLIVAPEGTNYGYLEGFSGRVGANWMTKHERELAIANNHRFLDELLSVILSKYDQIPNIHILGFSQGAATATRWASRWIGKVESLVLWAGGFAEDLVLSEAKEVFSQTKITLVLGHQDELITSESILKQEILLSNIVKNYEKIGFEGGHELDLNVLEKIFSHS
jgi:predicted esterase